MAASRIRSRDFHGRELYRNYPTKQVGTCLLKCLRGVRSLQLNKDLAPLVEPLAVPELKSVATLCTALEDDLTVDDHVPDDPLASLWKLRRAVAKRSFETMDAFNSRANARMK